MKCCFWYNNDIREVIIKLSGYNKILVDSFLNRPNVKRDDNTISFYQLYCEIRNYFNECYSKAYYNEKLVNKINKKLTIN